MYRFAYGPLCVNDKNAGKAHHTYVQYMLAAVMVCYYTVCCGGFKRLWDWHVKVNV